MVRLAAYVVLLIVAVTALVLMLYGLFTSLKPLGEALAHAGRLIPERPTWSKLKQGRA